jgi:hypothetical protein
MECNNFFGFIGTEMSPILFFLGYVGLNVPIIRLGKKVIPKKESLGL